MRLRWELGGFEGVVVRWSGGGVGTFMMVMVAVVTVTVIVMVLKVVIIVTAAEKLSGTRG